MTNLRQAAEQALEALQDTCDHLPARSGVEREVDEAITALQVALAHEALDRMASDNQKLGLYDDATPEVTPEVTPQVTTEVPCKTHPDAPHGFDRNASHSADRYVCECEGWEPKEKNT